MQAKLFRNQTVLEFHRSRESDGPPYKTILADPPWLERGGGKSKRGADRHYELMKTDDIIDLMDSTLRPLDGSKWAIDPTGCHLWMWVTNNFLTDGLRVMDRIGFRYVTNSVWVKMKPIHVYGPKEADLNAVHVAQSALQIGLGQYMRHSHEILLFGTSGKAMVPEPKHRPPSAIIAPRRIHSAKPDEQYELIERVSPGPRLEMFARRAWPSWDRWGKEAA